jgi:hypothetical protein
VAQLSASLPQRSDSHPLGCHGPGIPDRVGFEKLAQMLRFGCGYREAAVTPARRPRGPHRNRFRWGATLYTRRNQWLAAGGFQELEGIVLELTDLTRLPHQAPCGGGGAARSPVARGKPEP